MGLVFKCPLLEKTCKTCSGTVRVLSTRYITLCHSASGNTRTCGKRPLPPPRTLPWWDLELSQLAPRPLLHLVILHMFKFMITFCLTLCVVMSKAHHRGNVCLLGGQGFDTPCLRACLLACLLTLGCRISFAIVYYMGHHHRIFQKNGNAQFM